MLIGSKYTGLFYFIILFVVYIKEITKLLSFKRFLFFLIPFSLLGLFWYLRNFLLTGSPVYPQSILFFKGLEGWHSYLSVPLWKALIETPSLMFNAFIQELEFWPFIFILVPVFLIMKNKDKKNLENYKKVNRLLKVSILIALIYLFLPYDNKYLGMVLSIRYIFNLFSILTLIVFIFFQIYKNQIIIVILAIANSLIIFTHPYHPKLTFLYMPLLILILIYVYFKEEIYKKLKN
jgi:hypothetical protein